MNTWSNIEVSPEDPEIKRINEMEAALQYPDADVRQVRELITRFEVCHFKYRQHIGKIRESIINLKPAVNPGKIGATHIRSGEDAALRDGTGKSVLAMRYLEALRAWLNHDKSGSPGSNGTGMPGRVAGWLGERDPEKERLVRLLIARMKWDWDSYEKLKRGKKHKELADQCCRMDSCHYNFPANLDSLIRGIGELKPVKNFEGCGSWNSEIKEAIQREFADLDVYFQSVSASAAEESEDSAKAWLFACMLKTLKEQAGLDRPIGFR